VANCSKEVIAIFDPPILKKSGKHIMGWEMFWSGVRQKSIKGFRDKVWLLWM